MKKICILLVKFYRKHLSGRKKAPCCRFYPTCSAYALEALEKRNVFAALILITWRILRCNPMCRGGYDPVPERGFRRVMFDFPSADNGCNDRTEQGCEDTTEKQ